MGKALCDTSWACGESEEEEEERLPRMEEMEQEVAGDSQASLGCGGAQAKEQTAADAE